MAVRYLLVALISIILGVTLTLGYQRYTFEHIDDAKAPKATDSEYVTAREAMTKENADFANEFRGRIGAIEIDGVRLRCYFFYKKSGVIFEGQDLLYCFDRKSGAFLGRQ